MNFTHLQDTISTLDHRFRTEAGKSVNRLLTLRNWMVGFYIVEFEQQGEDRAEYGERLLQRLAEGLNKSSFSYRSLKMFRQFYLVYPQFGKIANAMPMRKQIHHLWADGLVQADNQLIRIGQSAIAQSDIPSLPPEQIIDSLSYTQLIQIMAVENPLARAFYEIESIRGNWSVRELKRQIGSLLYERTGMSQDKDELLRRVHQEADQIPPANFLRSPYLFDFLNFPENKLVDESTLKNALQPQ